MSTTTEPAAERRYYDPDPEEDGDLRDDEIDVARGICRECDTWGQIQCRVHADGYLASCRAADEEHALTQALRSVVDLAEFLPPAQRRRLAGLAAAALREMGEPS